MNLRPRRRDDPEVSLTPLIDVVFLLLIFFMVSTTFKHESELKVQLPQASAEAVERERKSLEIVIDAQGRYFVNDQEVVNRRLETLKRAIQTASGNSRDAPLVIRADGRAPHQAVVTAMDAAGQLGFVHMSIATVQAERDSEE
ncbi:MAG: biopolymer transporter ExbD [Gammaproteobacteria bacterium]|nr:biopolymer transporter ExbD [Gammaproteobacteria bacterium]NIR96695.1 biopolymer transporter ExbD [Gammaproteobacteria bacterium]NIT62399.1 biopolymer transporter ExbD [Gammaproteobacteria bacterium]NIV19331.1 biopolymer transporter ExbD [Gammaproteobacteria bacterium]NIX10292.1 biopolymer transporter ExbD [Gammaproteobacteria bacterium]